MKNKNQIEYNLKSIIIYKDSNFKDDLTLPDYIEIELTHKSLLDFRNHVSKIKNKNIQVGCNTRKDTQVKNVNQAAIYIRKDIREDSIILNPYRASIWINRLSDTLMSTDSGWDVRIDVDIKEGSNTKLIVSNVKEKTLEELDLRALIDLQEMSGGFIKTYDHSTSLNPIVTVSKNKDDKSNSYYIDSIKQANFESMYTNLDKFNLQYKLLINKEKLEISTVSLVFRIKE